MEVTIRIRERIAGRHRSPDDPRAYQADIVGADFDHHGIGRTPAEALLLAAEHWYGHEAPLPVSDVAIPD